MTAPRRRWSFGLRTLFVVVTVLGLGLGVVRHQLIWIRERHAFEASIPMQIHRNRYHRIAAPWPLDLLGEAGVEGVSVKTASQLRQATRLFPEAQVGVRTRD